MSVSAESDFDALDEYVRAPSPPPSSIAESTVLDADRVEGAFPAQSAVHTGPILHAPIEAPWLNTGSPARSPGSATHPPASAAGGGIPWEQAARAAAASPMVEVGGVYRQRSLSPSYSPDFFPGMGYTPGVSQRSGSPIPFGLPYGYAPQGVQHPYQHSPGFYNPAGLGVPAGYPQQEATYEVYGANRSSEWAKGGRGERRRI